MKMRFEKLSDCIWISLILMVMFIGLNHSTVYASTNGHSQTDAVNWIRAQEGSTYAGQYGYQCVDLVRAYYTYLGQAAPYGNANEYLNGNAQFTPSGWTKHYGTAGIQPGDITVWTGGSTGHVALVVDVGASSCTVMQQNGDSQGHNRTEGSKGHYGTQYYSGITGYIHPDFSNDNPVGTLDVVEGKSGAVRVRGWAFDPNDKSKCLDIHVYIGANSTAAGGEGHVIKADLERIDVHNVYGCGYNHGFDAVIDTGKTGTQTIYVYAINIGSGSNQLLGTATVNISDANPVGYLDNVEGRSEAVRVSGWAFDPDDKSKYLDIHVYIGADSTAAGGEGHSIKANLERIDVHNIYGCGYNHGFDSVISTKKTGRQTVYVYAINTGRGGNVLLGSKTVTIAKHVHNLKKTNAKEATTTSEGNKAYWTCNGCGRYFSDASGKNEITKNSWVIPKLNPNPVNDGNNGSNNGRGSGNTNNNNNSGKNDGNSNANNDGNNINESNNSPDKLPQPMTVKVAKKKTVKASKLKKKAQTIKPVTVKLAQGTVSYKITGGNKKSKKALKINSKNGKITVKKKTKKGTYKIKVTVTASGNEYYNLGSMTVDVSVRVK